ncbi:MAG: helix-turn-helix domain-containing protein [Gammaproteobacteria bacterium]|jgi:AraC-like DNA-binding protein|nr:helix-turn-helix domain-containing protein [Gammaproteobacteria bacterium]MBU2180232.1 helix-turn-helix domain-containing protein [Gammaproteobacteria bacterium]MBU2223225.1 helix-turn-helix domain-containing protein [Gammaproteobacteria bacterium]MBU2280751.1 helix-turn-helix domain-containing protein [Gammaproteobacteria bacterium]MBU2427859.1 helix-turn-helix domain-containing protein [Gammaproteobacteria bacterium]
MNSTFFLRLLQRVGLWQVLEIGLTCQFQATQQLISSMVHLATSCYSAASLHLSSNMAISDQLILLLSGLGSIHGLLLAAFLFFRQPGAWSNRFLAGVILMLSIRVLKSVLFHFNPTIGKQILQLGLSACFLIGPLLFCYCLHFIGKFHQSPLHRLHLIIPLLLLILVGGIYPYHLNLQLWNGPLYKIINYTWLAYTLLSVVLLWPKIVSLNLSNLRQHPDLLVVFCVVSGSGLIWCAYHFGTYTSYISGALTYSFLLCVGALTVFLHLQQKKTNIVGRYANKKISADTAEPLIVELEQFMQTQQVYLDANLVMPKLAKMLGWPTPKLSQLLNDNLKQSFNDFVNSYRIEHAKTLLLGEASMKMDDLAESAGFNSLSTFYAAFKKHTQLTPAKFKALRLADADPASA